MPYIPMKDRQFAAADPQTPGELNYALTRLLLQYIENTPLRGYQALNDCLGALAGAQAEFYRRVVVPFEDRKKVVNGEVYSTP